MTTLAQQSLVWKAALVPVAQGIPDDGWNVPAMRAEDV